jgi:uncharacterized RDD family membrane protein YckC
MHQKVMLLIMVLTIPLLVVVAGIISFVLLRMGYGIFVWAALPFLGLVLTVAVLGWILGRMAGEEGKRTSKKGSKVD